MNQESNARGSVKPPQSDEIDLREVFNSIGNLFSSLSLKLVRFILTLRRVTFSYRILILATLSLFAAFGVFWHTKDKSYFSSSMVIESEHYDRDLMEGAIEELNSLADQEAYVELGRKLNLSTDEAKNLRGMSVQMMMAEDDRMLLDAYLTSVKENKMSMEELIVVRDKLIRNNSKYLITVEVFSNELLQNIQKGIVGYLEANDYVERRLAVEEENLKALKGKLQEERLKLDNLKALMAASYTQLSEKGRTGSNNVILGASESANDPLNVYREDIKLYNEELAISKKLALMENIEVIKSFTPFSKPSNRSIIYVVAYSLMVGLAAAFGIILLLELNKALAQFEKKLKSKKELA